MIYRKEKQIKIAFCGPSTCGKSTVIEKILASNPTLRKSITVVKLDSYIYRESERPKTMMQGEMIPNLDLKESIDWNPFINEITRTNTPIVFVDGFITFADNRLHQLIDACVTFEYDIEKDFDVALYRRIKKSKRFKHENIPSNYLQNTWNDKTKLCYYCTYFHEIVWPEMIKHPEYRKPSNWNKPILELSATNDPNSNLQKTLEFIHPLIDPFLNK